MIEDDVDGEVYQGVKEREQPGHPPELYHGSDTRELADRRHGQSDQQEDQGPITRTVRDLLDGVGAQPAEVEISGE